MPKLTYAFSGGFTYKKFSFDFMLQGSYGAKLFNAYKYTTLNDAISSFNRSEEILKALDGPRLRCATNLHDRRQRQLRNHLRQVSSVPAPAAGWTP